MNFPQDVNSQREAQERKNEAARKDSITIVYLFLYLAENKVPQRQMSFLGPDLQRDQYKDAVQKKT